MSDVTRQLRLIVTTPPAKPPVEGVYLITDLGDDLPGRVARAFRGGVSALQYRPKGKGREYCLAEGRELRELCRRSGVTFIVNDDSALALELEADGVHLGQEDGAIADARRLLGPERLVGKSTHDLAEALAAQQEGADYIGFGAIYPTGSKAVTRIAGTAGLADVRGQISIPIVAIGGITAANACRVVDAGGDAVAVISSVLSHPRPETAVMALRLIFNRTVAFPRGTVLSVAGSDSGGGAGLQADIKTVTLLGSYAASVVTALTAQNTKGVTAIHGIPPSFVIEQMKAVLSDIAVDVVKTGMLHTPAIMEALAEYISDRPTLLPLVIDPVMVAKGGAALMERDALDVFRNNLMPLSYLVTPNLPEAERLLGHPVRTVAGMEQAVRDLHSMGAANVLLKGGHLGGQQSLDLLFDGSELHTYPAERIFSSNTHGTGCTFASAVAALLAQGEPLQEAVAGAKRFITAAIRLARPLGRGHGPVNHYLASQELKP